MESPRYRKLLSELSSATKKDLKKYFDSFDVNHSGYIEPVELRSVLKSAGLHFTDQVIDCLFKAADCDNNGKISFEEFIRLTMLLEGFKSSYNSIDIEKKGLVSTKALGQWLLDIGYNLNYRELKAIVHAVDENHSGLVEFEEFVELGLFLEGLRSLFRKHEKLGVVSKSELEHVLAATHLDKKSASIVDSITKSELNFDEFLRALTDIVAQK
eukprot:TRINITY_DN1005_c0_g1_i1.p1 TRINITY_DN1005_c0_g1~~TRINITY_DN1005_c0_g1_i1.p1  ORF type:complete len:213 (-),score=61.94 TRINITY_DN1005_c0_g1_i1:101-739(-)